jgi:hypothetical protein
MLRALVLLVVLLNAALFFWMQNDPNALQADREPQRLQRQVAPESIKVMPDVPGAAPAEPGASAGAPAASAAVGDATPPASAASVGAATGPGGAASAVKVSDTGAGARKAADLVCVESDGLDDTRAATLRQALAKAGIAPEAVSVRDEMQTGTWIVYMGRYADAHAAQQKADELKRMNISFEHVNQPAALAPGLSLGRYASVIDATNHLSTFMKRGVHTAKVVQLSAPAILHRLQVRASEAGWRLAVGAQHFGTCPTDGASNL